MAKVLVFGTGGVGCIYAYICQKGGASVTCVCRTNYTAIKESGIHIDSKLWGKVHTNNLTAVQTVSESASHGPFDYILVCSKAFPGTAALLADAVSPQTAIVLAQNGIRIEDEYAELYPSNTIISGVVYLPTTQVKPGYCEMGPLELFEIGTYPATASPEAKTQAEGFAAIYQRAGSAVKLMQDVQVARWIKIAVNAAWNPTTALTLCDDANFMRSSSDAGDLIVKIMQEVGEVAAAAGYPGVVTDEEINSQMLRSRKRLETGGKEPSMLTDVRMGRSMEVEAILGNTLRIARKLGVEAKYLEILYVLTKGLDFAMHPDERWRPIA